MVDFFRATRQWEAGFSVTNQLKSFTCACREFGAECLRRPLAVRPRDLDSCTQHALLSAAVFVPIDLHDPLTRTLCTQSCSSCTTARRCTAAGSTCCWDADHARRAAAKGRRRSSAAILEVSSHATSHFIRSTMTKYFWSTCTRAICRVSRKCIGQTSLKRFQ